MSTDFLRRGLLLAAVVPALLATGCAAGGSGQAMKAASPAPPTATDTEMTDSPSPEDTGTDTASPSPTGTGTGTGQGTPRGVVERFYRALGAGNADRVVNAFTSDGVAAVQGEETAEGAQALRDLFQGQENQGGGSPTIEESQVMGDRAFVRATAGRGAAETRGFFLLKQENGTWKIDRYMSNGTS